MTEEKLVPLWKNGVGLCTSFAIEVAEQDSIVAHLLIVFSPLPTGHTPAYNNLYKTLTNQVGRELLSKLARCGPPEKTGAREPCFTLGHETAWTHGF